MPGRTLLWKPLPPFHIERVRIQGDPAIDPHRRPSRSAPLGLLLLAAAGCAHRPPPSIYAAPVPPVPPAFPAPYPPMPPPYYTPPPLAEAPDPLPWAPAHPPPPARPRPPRDRPAPAVLPRPADPVQAAPLTDPTTY